ncbi:type II toxin-antitoxin system RelE/ParE family toxin [Leptospira interrogans]|uniref:PF06296 domain protein n=3 Tax=Leptospira interrogans TaxID=173 RepID=Q72UY7_LEPIC|nr:type II toxin-antitoxin system RelE/ParE family toxin [Leptospira interrogans]EMG22224.1 PF06296 domain protein [Leptospira interrogans serovar Copenhageni str. LT2050]OCA01893.1 PF06296 domain protein [Leptospira interrogans serovar Copenhageni/Icterohaemorrhagiae]OCC30518.1 PF06296 domain protein [Leptospira interrogans serovar Canicola]AAS69137.1 hypothetical protein LIC_10516 [Leptospira interrogans serovar Copenhageni str. Fiocruz L1-130]ARB96577.1 hypothetical protein A6J42_14640 [Lep
MQSQINETTFRRTLKSSPPHFEKELKQLSKKYQSISKFWPSLKNNSGIPIGQNYYKIRIPIASKGKSGGARVISCVVFVEKTVFLVSIYDKSEKENISDKDLEKIIKNL